MFDRQANTKTETTLSYASVMGLQSDIGLTGDQYQWLGSIFYFGKSYYSNHYLGNSVYSFIG